MTDNPPTINAKDWPKTIEKIAEYIRLYLGELKISLAYVICKNVLAIPEGDDPSAAYPTIQDERIARDPHTVVAANGMANPDPIYLVYCEKVCWDIISKITRDHSTWTYVNPAQKTRDGRIAYNGLYQHFINPNNVDTMATKAEDKLKNTV